MAAPSSSNVWLPVGLAVCLTTFAVLLGLRLGWFDDRISDPQPSASVAMAAEDEWMGIYQNGEKIGYTHRRLKPMDGGYRWTDETFLRIRAMGMVQDVRLDTKGRFNPDLSLSDFAFALQSRSFAFAARGMVVGDRLQVEVNGRSTQIPLDGPIYLTGAILYGFRSQDWVRDRTREFLIFDPSTMARRPVKVTWIGTDSVVETTGNAVLARKVAVEFAGVRALTWIDDQGRVIREEGMMGLTLRRTSREQATVGLQDEPKADWVETAAVPVSTPIENPADLRWLRLRVTGIDAEASLDGGRQEFADGVLTVSRETVPSPSTIDASVQQRHLSPSPLIQSDHPAIRKKAQDIAPAEDPPLVKVRRLVAWVHENLEKRPVVSVPNALEVLSRRMGDCNEHAVLLAALARAAGIPARVETGLVYLRGSFYYHAWNSVWLGSWVTVDALMNQIPADATHIRLVEADMADGLIDLMGMIGKIKIEVLAQGFD